MNIYTITKSSIFRIYKLLKLQSVVVRLLSKEKKVFENISYLDVENFRKLARSYNAVKEGKRYYNSNNKLVIKHGDRFISLSNYQLQFNHKIKKEIDQYFYLINSCTLKKHEVKNLLREIIKKEIFIKYNKEICYYIYFFVIRELMTAKLITH